MVADTNTAPKRGWTSAGLTVIPNDDASFWSTHDAAIMLGDDLKPDQIRSLIRLARIEPAGKRRAFARRGGRYVRVYAATDLIRAYEAVSDVMDS